LQIKSVKDIQLQQILNNRAGKSKSNLNKLRMTLKAMFKRALLSKLIVYNPAENLELPSAQDGTHWSITESERKYILKTAETHYAGLWIKTLLYTGLRPAETRALDWRHIDFDKELIHVEQSMKAATTEIGAPKSDSGKRDVPIPKSFIPELLKNRRSPFEPVFVQPTTGKRHTKRSMECLWDNFVRALDINMGAKVYRNKIILNAVAPDLQPYCLRHTYATDLQDMGVPINVARYLMGHSNISMTARVYTHTTDKAIKDVAAIINNQKMDSIMDDMKKTR